MRHEIEEDGMPRRALPVVMAVVVAVGLILGVRGLWGPGSGGAVAPGAGGDCIPLVVGASSEKAELLGKLAEEYRASGRGVDGRCVDFQVTELASGKGAEGLALDWDEARYGRRPDVWSPAASAWAELLEHRLAAAGRPNLVPRGRPSIAQSPLVIAMPQPMAEALGWPEKDLGWSDLAALARDPQGWGSHGHPEWGAFALGKTNPNVSTSGLDATIAAFFAASGRSNDLTTADVDDPENRTFVRGVEGSVVHYGDTTLTFLSNLYDAAARGEALSYISAVTVEEKSVWDYNQGNPAGDPDTLGVRPPPSTKLVAIYPKDGTLISDSPFLTLTAPWVDDAKRAAADDVLAYLREPAHQKRFQDAAFRNFDGVPGAPISRDNGMLPDEDIKVLAPPEGEVLDKIITAWSAVRKRANLVFVLDVSGSMAEAVSGTPDTRLDLAQRAAQKGFDLLGPDDKLSLWAFSSELDGEPSPYRVLVPPGPVESIRGDYTRAIGGLQARGDTALYTTTRAAVGQVQASFDPNRINAVVMLTDGDNDYPADDDLDKLLTELGDQDRDRQVKVFTIAYGADVDVKILERLATATSAKPYNASDPQKLDSVMVNVLSNF